MELQHRQVKLTKNNILVVPTVRDDRIIVRVTGKIEPDNTFSENLLRTRNNLDTEFDVAGTDVVQFRRSVEAITVDAVEIKLGAAIIRRPSELSLFQQWSF